LGHRCKCEVFFISSRDRGQVIAFEPDVWLVQVLRRTSAAQPATNARITVVPIAVASEVSLRDFAIAGIQRSRGIRQHSNGRSRGAAHCRGVQPGLAAYETAYVEGAELEVLRNQPRMLNEVRPVIISEVGSNTAEEITRILISASYCLFDGEKPFNKGQTINRASWSTVAIPEEKRDRLP
jgi:FkbM family methyltransferase